jgi:hypothetical protein
MTWTTKVWSVGDILTAAHMNNLYNNFAAFANKDTGAPVLKTDYVTAAMIVAGAVGASEIANLAVGANQLGNSAVNFQSKMKLGTAASSANVSSSAQWVVPFGVYTYYTSSLNIFVEYFINGAWRAAPNLTHGQIVGDNSTVRLNSSSGTPTTVFYDETWD